MAGVRSELNREPLSYEDGRPRIPADDDKLLARLKAEDAKPKSKGPDERRQ